MYDVVVCGGGVAGCAAGYIAAKYGLKTLIIEKNIHLGGSVTSALVIPAMKSDTKDINCEFYNDLITKLKKYNAQIDYIDDNKGWFNPELMKIALDSMMKDVNCEVLFTCDVSEAKCYDNNIVSVKIDGEVLSLYIESLYFVDATGNSKLSKILNHKFLTDKKNEQPMTLRFHVSGINLEKFSEWIMNFDKDRDVTSSAVIGGQTHLSTACTWDTAKEWALRPVFEEAIKNGDLKELDSAYFQVFSVPGMPETLSFNCPRISHGKSLSPNNPKDISIAAITGREQIWRIYNFTRKYFPGFENAYISKIADMIGIRESNRVQGQYIYSIDDMQTSKKFKNAALHASYPIDIHSYDKDSSTLKTVVQEYCLPIESLMSPEYNNLLFAGRNLSATFEAQAALRIQTSCFSMGEAVAKHIRKIVK